MTDPRIPANAVYTSPFPLSDKPDFGAQGVSNAVDTKLLKLNALSKDGIAYRSDFAAPKTLSHRLASAFGSSNSNDRNEYATIGRDIMSVKGWSRSIFHVKRAVESTSAGREKFDQHGEPTISPSRRYLFRYKHNPETGNYEFRITDRQLADLKNGQNTRRPLQEEEWQERTLRSIAGDIYAFGEGFGPDDRRIFVDAPPPYLKSVTRYLYVEPEKAALGIAPTERKSLAIHSDASSAAVGMRNHRSVTPQYDHVAERLKKVAQALASYKAQHVEPQAFTTDTIVQPEQADQIDHEMHSVAHSGPSLLKSIAGFFFATPHSKAD